MLHDMCSTGCLRIFGLSMVAAGRRLHWRRCGVRTSASNRTEVELNRSADMALSSWASAHGSWPASDPPLGASVHGRQEDFLDDVGI